MSLTKLSGAFLLIIPLAAWGQPTPSPEKNGALDSLLVSASADALPPPPSAPAAAPASRSNFCTTNLYTYQDLPVSAYELNCSNASLGLALHHATSYDQDALFSRDGRCSPKHASSIALSSDETRPFELAHETTGPQDPGARRELQLYRDGDGLQPGEFLLNLTWIQGGDSYQLGYIPETRGTPNRIFRLAGGRSGSGSFVLKAADLPFNFASAKTVNGRKIEYKDVPVDCEMTISVDSWYGR